MTSSLQSVRRSSPEPLPTTTPSSQPGGASRLRVLLSAYACEPDKGSEPGVGWNLARALAAHCDVWVLTRENNRPAIERALGDQPVPHLRFVYFDLPPLLRFWKRGQRGLRLYYFLWQVGVVMVARRLHRAVAFDLLHHVTFGTYWSPSLLPLVRVPFIWGPVGGGDTTPRRFLPSLGLRGCLYEAARLAALSAADFNPLVRMTARRCAIAFTTTPVTAARVQRLGARKIEHLPQLGLTNVERGKFAPPRRANARRLRLVSIARLLPWKGIHLGLIAFARTSLADARYWIVGDGPDRRRLAILAHRLGIGNRVRFLGSLPRAETMGILMQCDILLHPSLHDSGAFVCLEAMAAGKPVICLDLSGPATQVTSSAGLRIPARTPRETITAIADGISRLAHDPDERWRMGVAGRLHATEQFDWERKAATLLHHYTTILATTRP